MTKQIKKYSNNDIIRNTIEIYDSVNLEDLSEEDYKAVQKSVIMDKLKDDLKTEIKKRKINIDKIYDMWFNSLNSKQTKRSYNTSISMFFNWIITNGYDLYKIDYLIIDEYISYISKYYNENRTIKNRIAGISSFLSYLERRDVIKKNYFKGCRLPKHDDKISGDEYPDDKDIKNILKFLNKKPLLRIVIQIIIHHGLRIGAFETIEIDKNGNMRYTSKRKEYIVPLKKSILNKLESKKPFKSSNTIQYHLQKEFKEMEKKGIVKTFYSPHDIRHYAAVKFYKRNNNDMYKTMKFLGHSSIVVTQNYLRSLGMEEK